MKIIIGGTEYEVDEKVAEEFKRLKTAASDQEEAVGEKEKEVEKANATADELNAQLIALKAEKVKDSKADGIESEVNDRLEIIKVADSMGIEVKTSDTVTMKKEILTSKYKDIKLDDKSDAYIDARYDVMTDGFTKANQSHKKVVEDFKPKATDHDDFDQIKDKEL